MTARANHWKLGLFMVAGFALAGAASVMVGAIRLDKEVITVHSYHAESVQGLNIGGSVTFRGVPVGEVVDIRLAPDNVHVAVAFEMPAEKAARLGWYQKGAPGLDLPKGLRAQLQAMGVTGLKYLELDLFEPDSHPPPELPFEPAARSIPSTPSTLTSLRDSVMVIVDRFPRIFDRTMAILEELHALLREVRTQDLPAQSAVVLQQLQQVLSTMDAQIARVPVTEMSDDMRKAAQGVERVTSEVEELVAALGSDRGLLASVQQTSDSVGRMAGRASDMGYQLDSTLRDVQALTHSLRAFMTALERDPDMLLKGRAESP